MAGIMYVPEGEGGHPRMEGAIFPRRKKSKRFDEYEREEETMYGKMMKGKGMHKMPDGTMMADKDMPKHGKKKGPLHPRDAMKTMKKSKMSREGY